MLEQVDILYITALVLASVALIEIEITIYYNWTSYPINIVATLVIDSTAGLAAIMIGVSLYRENRR